MSPASGVQSNRGSRRERQRRENPERAQLMHAARIKDGARPHADAADETPEAGQRFYVGCSGWFYWDWQGKFYPQALPTSQWFDYYAQHFNTVELNAPFYSWPKVETVKTWLRQARQKQFTYTVKVNELITHSRQFEGTKQLIKDFGYIADLLGHRMGCFLFQLPPRLHYSLSRLKKIVHQLEPGRRNVIEFRHHSWWNQDVYAALRDHGIIFCCCSGPKLPDDLIKTADDIYVRFHGPERWYRYDYSTSELDGWAARIKESGAKRLWAYFNNDWNAKAVKNAQQLLKRLKAAE